MKKLAVFLSPLAERKLVILLDYLTEEWGDKSKINFLSRFRKATEKVSSFPKSCPESIAMKGLYKCIITKQSSFYYRIKNEEVEIITLIDNRQDQAKVFEEIKRYFIS